MSKRAGNTLMALSGNLGLHVIRCPSGVFTYVGSVPTDLYYVDGATPEQIEAGRQCGDAFGPKRRYFKTEQDAITCAESHGYTVVKDPA